MLSFHFSERNHVEAMRHLRQLRECLNVLGLTTEQWPAAYVDTEAYVEYVTNHRGKPWSSTNDLHTLLHRLRRAHESAEDENKWVIEAHITEIEAEIRSRESARRR
jgi:hypothetical protein